MNSLKLFEYTKFICVDGIETELENISFIPQSLEELVGYINSNYGKLLKALTFVYCQGNEIKINKIYLKYYQILTNDLDTRDFFDTISEVDSNDPVSENETDGNETDGNETDGNETDGNETDGN